MTAEVWECLAGGTLAHARWSSLKGHESLVPLFDTLVEEGIGRGVRQMFLGMPHRGRPNAFIDVTGSDVQGAFDQPDPDSDIAFIQQDPPYHLGGRAHRLAGDDKVALELAPNPPHLQSAYLVVCGMARTHTDEHPGTPCLPVMAYGDVAFVGQGVIMETLSLTRYSSYTASGIVYVIVNNQIGFTTPNVMGVCVYDYYIDVTRVVGAPMLYISTDDSEAVVRATWIAIVYRMKHGTDIVIDLIGYRRPRYSEYDTSVVTQPVLYAAIAVHPIVTRQHHIANAKSTHLTDLHEAVVRDLWVAPGKVPHVIDVSMLYNAARRRPQPLSSQRVQTSMQALTTPPDDVSLYDVVYGLHECWYAAVSSDAHTAD